MRMRYRLGYGCGVCGVLPRRLRGLLPCTAADVYADPLDVVMALGREEEITTSSRGSERLLIQDRGYRFPRNCLVGNTVNRGGSAPSIL
jgi:hypothetical protein